MSNLVAAATSLGIQIESLEAIEIAVMEEYLRLVDGGDDLINGVVTVLKESLISQLVDVVSMDFEPEMAARKVTKFLQLIYKLNEAGYFKKKLIEWPIAISLESNLLRYLVEDRVNFPQIFADYSLSMDQKAHAVGAFFLSLSLESGVLVKPFNAGLIRSIQHGFQEIEGFVFFETSVPFEHSRLEAVRRTYIDPLSLAIFRNNRALICNFISSGDTEDGVFIKDVGKAIRLFVHEFAKLQLSMAVIQKLVISNIIQRVPGFIYARQSGLLRSHDTPLHVLVRSHGFSMPRDEEPAATSEDAGEADSHDEDDINSSEGEPKSKAVNANFVTERDIKEFIEWIQMHPDLDTHQRKAVIYLISMAFYVGLRRGEAFGLRASEIILSKTESFGRIRANSDRGLKSSNAKRDFPFSWLPETFRNELINVVQSSEGSSEQLLKLYAGSKQSAALFDRCNLLLKEFFGDESLTVHTLRHSFATRSLFRLMAASLRVDEQVLPEFIRQEITDSQKFAESIVGKPRPSANYLWHLSKIMGHADPTITLHTYLHNIDYLTYFSFAAARPMSYSSSVNRLLRIDYTQASRDAVAVSPCGNLGWSYPASVTSVYAAPMKRILQDTASIKSVRLEPGIGKNSYRSLEWSELAKKIQKLKFDVDAHPQNYGQKVVRLCAKPLRRGVALQVIACLSAIKTSKLPKELLIALANGFDSKQGHYSLPWSTDQSQQVAALIQAGFEVHVKALSQGIEAPFTQWVRAHYKLKGQGTLLLKLRPRIMLRVMNQEPRMALEKVKPQGVFWMLCSLLV